MINIHIFYTKIVLKLYEYLKNPTDQPTTTILIIF